jgi:hypothetical protein
LVRIETGLQIVIAVIASGIFVTAFTSFYSDFYKVPYLKIEPIDSRYGDENKAFKITNIGRAPATNVTLTLKAPEEINITHHDIFATETLEGEPKINNNLLVAHIPRFTHDNGSEATIDTNSTAHKINTYTLFATYNEGSSTSGDKIPYRFQLLEFAATNTEVYTLILLSIIIIPSLFIILLSLRKRQLSISDIIFKSKRKSGSTS